MIDAITEFCGRDGFVVPFLLGAFLGANFGGLIVSLVLSVGSERSKE